MLTPYRILLFITALCSLSACNSFEVNLNQQHSQTWSVAGQTLECQGVAIQQCMQVKKKKDGEWQNFYDQIEGFTYEEGFEYILRIAITPIEQPMADGPSRLYTLLDILSKVPSEMPAEE